MVLGELDRRNGIVYPAFDAQTAEMTDFKQETVARALGIQIDSAKLHDASYDIQLTKEIYNRISSLSFMG